MRQVIIFKVGQTFAETPKELGDFEDWIQQLAAGEAFFHWQVIDLLKGDPFPSYENCSGAVITGSHAMVTDRLDWSVELEAWLRGSVDFQIPILGICYGHQLIAQAFGGEVGFHPQGTEIGTVEIFVDEASQAPADPLFQDLPASFKAHVVHSQSVFKLPPNAVRLAYNDYEANHGFRIGQWIWGVQFHPEFNEAVMKIYLQQEAQSYPAFEPILEGLLSEVIETPFAAKVLKNFAALIAKIER